MCLMAFTQLLKRLQLIRGAGVYVNDSSASLGMRRCKKLGSYNSSESLCFQFLPDHGASFPISALNFFRGVSEVSNWDD